MKVPFEIPDLGIVFSRFAARDFERSPFDQVAGRQKLVSRVRRGIFVGGGDPKSVRSVGTRRAESLKFGRRVTGVDRKRHLRIDDAGRDLDAVDAKRIPILVERFIVANPRFREDDAKF